MAQQTSSTNLNSNLNSRLNSLSKNTNSNTSNRNTNSNTSNRNTNSNTSNRNTNSNTSNRNTNSNTSNRNSNNLSKRLKDIANNNTIVNILPNTENYTIVMGVIVSIVLLVLMFFFSKTFNVGRTVERIKMYERYQKITNYQYGNKRYSNIKLKDVCILSSYNSCLNNNQMLTYTSENVLKQVIRSGARFVEFNVFSSKYGANGKPVVSNGYKHGQWKMTLNSIPFENVISVLHDNAFTVLGKESGAPNNNDPLFISLNLSTGYNMYCLDMMADILLDYFSDRLLDPKYAFQFSNNLHNIEMRELQNKVIIFASSGYEGSKLEELINATWIDETKHGINDSAIEGFISNDKNKDRNGDDILDVETVNKVRKSINKDSTKAKIITKKNKNKLTLSNNNLDDDTIDHIEYIDNEFKKIKAKDTMQLLNDDLEQTINTQSKQSRTSSLANNDKQSKFIKTLDKLSEEFNNDGETDLTNDTDITQFVSRDKPNIIRISSLAFNRPEFNPDRIKEHNKAGLTIVVPNVEGDFFTQNYDPLPAMNIGCQFICMNFQKINEAMDTYITKFEKKGILPFNDLDL